jgi:hypothetical protein
MSRPQNWLSFSLRKRMYLSHLDSGEWAARTAGSWSVPSMGGMIWSRVSFSGGEVEGFVDVKDGLDGVVAGVDVGEKGAGVADGLRVDHEGLGGVGVDGVHTKPLGGLVGFFELHAGLGGVLFAEDEDEMAVERSLRGDGDLDVLGVRGRGEEESGKQGKQRAHDVSEGGFIGLA